MIGLTEEKLNKYLKILMTTYNFQSRHLFKTYLEINKNFKSLPYQN